MSIPSVLDEKSPTFVWIIIALVVSGLIILAFNEIILRATSDNPISQTQTALVQTQTAIASIIGSTQVIPTNSPSILVIPPSEPNIPLSVTPSVSTSTLPSTTRPSFHTISNGETFSLTDGWAWICTGDLSVNLATGVSLTLFDDQPQTGLVLVIEENSRANIYAPYGGYCEPFSQMEKNNRVSTVTSRMLADGCENGCTSVNIQEVSRVGNIINDAWTP